MIQVRILGSGLIPRGYGLAPRKEPIWVDFKFLSLLLYSQNLKVQVLDPEKDQFIDMTLFNAKKLYDKYNRTPEVKKPEVKQPVQKEEVKPEVESIKEVVHQEPQQFQYSKKNKFDKKKKYEQRHSEPMVEVKEEPKVEEEVKPEEAI